MTYLRKNALLCPNCRKLISADEPRCPYCGITAPGSRWKNNPVLRGFSSPEQLIRGMIFLNVGMFLITILFKPGMPGLSLNPFMLLAPDNNSLLLLGATGAIPIDRFGRWWTLLSANYLHGGMLHILFNMMALRQLAPLTAREYGTYRMFAVYTLSGVFGFWISYLAGVPFTIGASAAICGLMGAILYYGKTRGGIYGQLIYRQVGAWAAGIFLFGFIIPGINNWGHGGGLIAGVIFGFLLGYRENRREHRFHKLLGGLCFTVTLLALAWAVLSALYYRLV